MVGRLKPLLLCSLFCWVSSSRNQGSENQLEECDVSRVVQVVVLFDITPVNASQSFSNQQIRLTRTLRHLDVVLAGRNKSYAVIAFHRVPVVLKQLDAANHQDVGVVIDQIQGLRPRKRRRVDESSPAKALDAAAEHVSKYGVEGAKTLVLLVHDGHNTDLIAETLEATAKLVEMKADVFVITGSDHPDISALVGYAQERAKVFTQQEESVQFFEALNNKIGVCFEEENIGQEKLAKPQFSNHNSKKATEKIGDTKKPGLNSLTCTSPKVDLLILLDTSGSIFHSFSNERGLAVELLEKIELHAFSNQLLQVGLLKFATDPIVVQSLTSNNSKAHILEVLKGIQFTGNNTRIANAVEKAIEEFEKMGRKDAKQIVVLISDGHGQEFWNKAQTAGKRLQAVGAKIFAVTTSTDYNAAELELYTGHKSNVFVGPNSTHFVAALSLLINKCFAKTSSKNSVLNPLNEETNSTQNSTINEIMAFPDPFQLLNSPNQTVEIETTTDKGQKENQLLEESESKNKSSSSQLDTPHPTRFEEEDQVLSHVSQRLRNQQNTSRLPDDCLTDVMFLVDKANPSSTQPFNYTKQLELLIELVAGLDAGDLAIGKIKLAAVSFGGKDAKTEISFSENSSKTQFMQTIAAIYPIKAHSSFTKGIQKAIEEITAHRRSDARLLVIVAWSGINGRNNDAELSAAANQLFNLPRSEAFAIALNPNSKFERLKELSGGNIFHVYVDARVRQFVEHTSAALLACTLPPSEKAKRGKAGPASHEPMSSLERVEELQSAAKALTKLENCDEDAVDLVVVLDLSTGNQEEIGRKKQAAKDLLRQSSAESYERRIRPALILLGSTPSLTTPMISLRTSISRDDALFAIDRLEGGAAVINGQQEHSSGNLTIALSTARLEVQKFHRSSSRLALVVFPTAINSSGINFLEDLNKGVKSILELEDKTAAFVLLTQYMLPPKHLNDSNNQAAKPKDFDNANGKVEIARQNNLSLQVFNRKSRGGYERFLSSTRHQIFECKTGQKLRKVSVNGVTSLFSKLPEMALAMDSVVDTSNAAASNDNTANLKLVRKSTEEEDDLTTESTTLNPSTFSHPSAFNDLATAPTTLHPTLKLNIEEAQPTVSFLNDECKVDLIFVIDTSQSVADEFSKQLQFAVDLVKRLPDDDFSSRVQVAAVTFHKSAKIQFPFGQLKEKGAVLDALLNVMHTGGSTSAVSGVELAVDEIERARRKEARLMVVLVSDGNSQDPWEKVVSAADRLRSVNADVYAVTVSHDYFFRELELYAGNKWFVYIDARIRQFLDEAETSLVECKSPSVPESSGQKETTTSAQTTFETTTTTASLLSSPITPNITGECDQDPVDLLFILDTSTSVEKEFYAEKYFALDLIKVLPEVDFKSGRISIALVKFNGTASLQFGFGNAPGSAKGQTRNDVLYSIELIEHTGGQTSLVAGTEVAVAETVAHRRPNARLVVVIISDGNSQDDFPKAQATAQKLRQLGGEIYAVTLSKTYYFDELKEYTGNEKHIFTDEKIANFLQEVGQSVVGCPGSSRPMVHITMAPNTEVSVTPSTTIKPEDKTNQISAVSIGDLSESVKEHKPESNNSSIPNAMEFARDESPLNAAVQRDPESGVQKDAKAPVKTAYGRCKYSKMDLIIILDASTSREGVFEHQRELALSLIERLPISKDDTHVATGINSFTNTPTLRQTLGLGRDRDMVRKAIEDIKYNGGSTLTAQAVELAVEDLQRGKRPDALQVVVLMNDGVSQDAWDKVLATSQKLASTGAERFGVALGSDVDLRELRHYIGNEERIYRDGSTERFLNDVVSLLGAGEKDCPSKTEEDNGLQFQVDAACNNPYLDLVVLFDNSDNTPNLTDPRVNSNRYLLLDVLGSLPLGEPHLKISIVSFATNPKLEHTFNDLQDRDAIFRRVESIQPIRGKASYARAVHTALNNYKQGHRQGARGLFLVVGNGSSAMDDVQQRSSASNALRKTKDLSVHAVDSGKDVEMQTLSAYTGDSQRVYNYDRNAELAKLLHTLATGAQKDCEVRREDPIVASSLDEVEQYSTPKPRETEGDTLKMDGNTATPITQQQQQQQQIQRDIAAMAVEANEEKDAFGLTDEQKMVAIRKQLVTQVLTPAPPSISTTHQRSTAYSTTPPSTIIPQKANTAEGWTTLKAIFSTSTFPALVTKDGAVQSPATNTTLVSQKKAGLGKKIRSSAQALHPNNILSQPSLSSAEQVPSNKPASSRKFSFTPAPTHRRFSTTEHTNKYSLFPVFKASEAMKEFSIVEGSPARPGCLVDFLILLDSSGSVQETFEREKHLAASILSKLRVGKDNARVSLIKFASEDKVRTLHTFAQYQSKQKLLETLEEIQFSSGVTAIHSVLLQAITEYSPVKGARPGTAEPLVVIFTDGFGKQDVTKEAELLRRLVPRVYAVAVNHEFPINRAELEKITGDPERVFTDANIQQLHDLLKSLFRTC